MRNPRLLVPWEGRWESFAAAVRPALAPGRRSTQRPLLFPFPYRKGNFGASLALHMLILALLLEPVEWLAGRATGPALDIRQYEVTMLPSLYLPEVADAGGAESGREGRSGGREAYHPRQVIRVQRGSTAQVPTVAEAPRLNLPRRDGPLANMLVIPAPTAPPAPVAAIPTRVTVAAPSLAQAVPPRPAVGGLATSRPAGVLKLDGVMAKTPPPAAEVAAVVDPMTVSLTPRLATPFAQLEGAVRIAPPAAGSAPFAGNISENVAEEGAAARIGVDDIAVVAAQRGMSGELSGFVLSTQAGDSVGLPSGAGTGALAASPQGSGATGLGGSGGGSGISHGEGTGSGAAGDGPGSGATGSGLGSDLNARGGISPGPGPGGTGRGAGRSMGGITIQGGTVNLPSFATPERRRDQYEGTSEPRNKPALTVVATSRSGGGLPLYGTLEADRVYTIYIETRAGVAVMQYAELQGGRVFEADLTAPEPVYVSLPGEVRSRLILSCVLGREGRVKDVRILEGADSEVNGRVVEAVGRWQFRPALKEDDPVEIRAILGFALHLK